VHLLLMLMLPLLLMLLSRQPLAKPPWTPMTMLAMLATPLLPPMMAHARAIAGPQLPRSLP
jgi:hypothetical protein